jgi:hypothetical protein
MGCGLRELQFASLLHSLQQFVFLVLVNQRVKVVLVAAHDARRNLFSTAVFQQEVSKVSQRYVPCIFSIQKLKQLPKCFVEVEAIASPGCRNRISNDS